jgi:tRNA1(Val) A37 N6-methylase TrmN6
MERKNKVEVINDLLGYEGLKIIQRPDIFNFSLDSTILADFVTINSSTKQIIDLGCGNGYIPIFLTLRTKAHITGIEIQEEIADLAIRSVKLNNLEEQITIKNMDMKEVPSNYAKEKIDVITCNPPYFPYTPESLINESTYQTIARHEVKITLDEVLKIANSTLKDGGIFAMVHRSERLIDILESFRRHTIEPKRIRFVYPKTNSTVSLAVMVEGIKSTKKGGLKILPPLYVNNSDGSYTEEILKIFNYKKGE